jgi:hypothetical protein
MIVKKDLQMLARVLGSSMNQDKTLNTVVFVGKLQHALSRLPAWDNKEFNSWVQAEYEKKYLTPSKGKVRQREVKNCIVAAKLTPATQAMCERAIELGNMKAAAEEYKVSREYIRQLLKAHYNLTGKDLEKARLEKACEKVRKAMEIDQNLTLHGAATIYGVRPGRIKHLFPDQSERRHRKRVAVGKANAIDRGQTLWSEVMEQLNVGQSAVVDISSLKFAHTTLHNISKKMGIPISLKILDGGMGEITRLETYRNAGFQNRVLLFQSLKPGEIKLVAGNAYTWRYARDKSGVKAEVKRLSTPGGVFIKRLEEDSK